MAESRRPPRPRSSPPRVEALRVSNYRAIRHIELKNLTPLTVLLGPNGSGKSTVFDVFDFLSECFRFGLRHAWDRRGRAKELKTRGQSGPIVIEIKYRERPKAPLITFHLEIDEEGGRPVVIAEWLQWKRKPFGAPFRFLTYSRGKGEAVSGDAPDEDDKRIPVPLRSADLIAVNSLGQFEEHPRVAALRDFITGWYVSYLTVDDARGQPEAGPQELLSKTGDNLANVVQYLKEEHPKVLEEIFAVLRRRVPRLETVLADAMPDGRLLLQIKDAPFDRPVLSRFASDGTLKMLAYLIALHSPEPPPFIGIEEPENHLHPRLLPELAEECRKASANSQLLVTTHSPFFLNGTRPPEVRILYRDPEGYTQSERAADIPGIPEFISAGASMGHLWLEGRFGIGDPMVDSGLPSQGIARAKTRIKDSKV